MTTTPTSSPELLDLDKLEARARAATPGPWSWWTSNSTLRLTGADGRDGGVLYGYARQGDGDVNCAPNDQAFIAAANPAAVLALIALARRAQPEGEAQQADLKQVAALLYNALNDAYQASMFDGDELKRVVRAMSAYNRYRSSPAATLSPLCGAQHAESGKEAQCTIGVGDGSGRLFVHGDYDSIMAVRSIIIENEYLRAAQQAAAPANSPVIPDGSTSAPGTPEAPAAAEKLYASWQHSQPDRYNIPPWRLLAESVKIEWERRAAAQLDGGQEGGAT